MMVFSPAKKMYIKAFMLENYDMSERLLVVNTKTAKYASELEKTSNHAADDPKSITKHYVHRNNVKSKACYNVIKCRIFFFL